MKEISERWVWLSERWNSRFKDSKIQRFGDRRSEVQVEVEVEAEVKAEVKVEVEVEGGSGKAEVKVKDILTLFCRNRIFFISQMNIIGYFSFMKLILAFRTAG